MKVVFLGAEIPSNRTLLESTSATHVGVSFWGLQKRGMPQKTYLLENYFKDDYYIYVYPGIPKDAALSAEELDDFAAEYEEFIANNIDRINLFSEIAGVASDFVEEQRRTSWAQVPPGKFLPAWDPESGFAELNLLADKYLDIAIPGEALEDSQQLITVTRTLVRTKGTRFHILGSAKPDILRQITAETASTLSWLSPMRNGETIVWDGTKLVRYPARMKDQARPRYRNTYIKAGIDPELILEDDDKEVCRLAVWSYLQYEARLNGVVEEPEKLSYNLDKQVSDNNAELAPDNADKKPFKVGKLLPRNPEEMGNLPVFGYSSEQVVDADGTIRDVPTVHSQQVTLRSCDSCFVASNCPAFKPQSVCAFKLPVEVKTKEQLKSLINAVIEMQGQRVAFMRFSEEMSGGYADPNVSKEIDRLFKLIKTTKELDDSREFIRMTVERQGGAGVLSSIFGDRANILKELPNQGLDEAQTNEVIRDLTDG